MNDFHRTESARLGDQVIVIASIYEGVNGEKSYLCEFADGSFSRVRGEALMPLGAEAVERKEKLASVASIAAKFLRGPSPLRKGR
jgi:hypothetical protein